MESRLGALVVCSLFLLSAAPKAEARELTLEDRVAAAHALEEVYWAHRTWPAQNAGPKPPFAAVLGETAIRARVRLMLRESARLEALRGRPITGGELQIELTRMARETKAPEMLLELFAAVHDDPFVIAECLARPALVARLLASEFPESTPPGDDARLAPGAAAPPPAGYSVPAVAGVGCTPDAWALSSLTNATGANVPLARQLHTAVWTGAEMIVWGGWNGTTAYNTGGRYDPATDSWSVSSLTNASGANVPAARFRHTAVWTGTEMIVWGGQTAAGSAFRTGGRYNVAGDAWATSSLTVGSGANVPAARLRHTAIWTGTEMIVWGGTADSTANARNTGGRYNPSADTWSLSVLTNASGAFTPVPRVDHTAIWSGTEMIIWGGLNAAGAGLDTGGRYVAASDSWAVSSLTNGTGAFVPGPRHLHSAVFSGSEMIIWGGAPDAISNELNDGGRFSTATDTWVLSSLTNATGVRVPTARRLHTALWTGTDMIVWGGSTGGDFSVLNNGGRYDPVTDGWALSSLTTPSGANVPSARKFHTAVWTGASDHRMIVWGGSPNTATGGLYCAACIATVWYLDVDGDGYGIPLTTQVSCTQPPGYAPLSGDCDDTNPAIHPGAPEACNGADDDCDTVMDEGTLCSDGAACTADVCNAASGCSATHTTVNLDPTGFSTGRVDGRDLVVLAAAWNSCPGDPRYDAAANLDQGTTIPGSCIDLSDFHLFMDAYGLSCP